MARRDRHGIHRRSTYIQTPADAMQILRTLNHYQTKSFALKYIFKSLIFTKKKPHA